MAKTLHVDESGREHVDAAFVVGGALVHRRRGLASRLGRVPFAWPFLDRPLHRAHLRSPGHLALRWSTWAASQQIVDPSPELGLFDGTLADRAREMWANEWFDEHLRFQTWVARTGHDIDDSALLPAAFLRVAEQSGTSPPETHDLDELKRWARAARLRGRVVDAFLDRIEDTVVDALTGGDGDLELVLTRDAPRGCTLGERDRYLRMLRSTLSQGRARGAVRARVQQIGILRPDPPTGPQHGDTRVELHDAHIESLGIELPAERVRFWRDARPGDEAADLLVSLVRVAGARAVAPVPVLEQSISPSRGGHA